MQVMPCWSAWHCFIQPFDHSKMLRSCKLKCLISKKLEERYPCSCWISFSAVLSQCGSNSLFHGGKVHQLVRGCHFLPDYLNVPSSQPSSQNNLLDNTKDNVNYPNPFPHHHFHQYKRPLRHRSHPFCLFTITITPFSANWGAGTVGWRSQIAFSFGVHRPLHL